MLNCLWYCIPPLLAASYLVEVPEVLEREDRGLCMVATEKLERAEAGLTGEILSTWGREVVEDTRVEFLRYPFLCSSLKVIFYSLLRKKGGAKGLTGEL